VSNLKTGARAAALTAVAAGAAATLAFGVAGAVGSGAQPFAGGGYGYDCGGGYGYGNTCPTTSPSASATASGTATPSQSATASPTASAAPRFAVTLATNGIFVKLGQLTTFSGTVTRNGLFVGGQSVQLFETYSDGKIVSLGVAQTALNGTYSLTVRPLYIGNVVAVSNGAVSTIVPSRVTVTYRTARASRNSRGKLIVHAETRPGFITSSSRQERVQILLVDRVGHQLRQLAIVNAKQRSFFPGEAQGTNAIDYTSSFKLTKGTYRIVVKVIGTPVNTGASSSAVTVNVK
jgi:hypothetical protein